MFGVHEALDQVGAIIGPGIVAAVLAWKGSYSYGFAILIVPATIALAVLVAARLVYPRPGVLEQAIGEVEASGLRLTFWLYLAAVCLIAFGFFDYPLAAFHIKAVGVASDKWIPLIYAWAMGMDALGALLFGRLYDWKGFRVLIYVVLIVSWSAPLVFLSGPVLLTVGMGLWGIGMGAQESIIRAVVAVIVRRDLRATGYGVFNAGFGLAWFAGSALMGVLYERSLMTLTVFSVLSQLLSLPLLYVVYKRMSAVYP